RERAKVRESVFIDCSHCVLHLLVGHEHDYGRRESADVRHQETLVQSRYALAAHRPRQRAPDALVRRVVVLHSRAHHLVGVGHRHCQHLRERREEEVVGERQLRGPLQSELHRPSLLQMRVDHHLHCAVRRPDQSRHESLRGPPHALLSHDLLHAVCHAGVLLRARLVLQTKPRLHQPDRVREAHHGGARCEGAPKTGEMRGCLREGGTGSRSHPLVTMEVGAPGEGSAENIRSEALVETAHTLSTCDLKGCVQIAAVLRSEGTTLVCGVANLEQIHGVADESGQHAARETSQQVLIVFQPRHRVRTESNCRE
ncbi:hypothetical protein PMAYCL1PPCAC_01251, partial [Pristionchus mayeri]